MAEPYNRNDSLLLILCAAVAIGVVLSPIAQASGDSLRQLIEDEAVVFLSRNISAPHDSLAITIGLPAVAIDPADVRDIAFDMLSGRPAGGTVPFKVTLFLSDGTTRDLTATARVRVYDTVAVSSARIQRHEILEINDIRLERREVTHLADAYFSDPVELAGQRTKRLTGIGKIFTASDVEADPLIKRGSGVMVCVAIGSVTVSSKAKALEDGSLGDVIKVQDLGTRKRLTGIVASERLVLLDASTL
jgi:flagella basal body P-ring formation protein FlgA